MWTVIALASLGFASKAVVPENCPSTQFHLSDTPNENWYISNCYTAVNVIVQTPQPDSNLTYISNRLVVAFPAGNSGVAAYWAPGDGRANGTLGLRLDNSTANPIQTFYNDTDSGNMTVGVQGTLIFNDTALLTWPLMGSIRTIRDFGYGAIDFQIQNSIKYMPMENGWNLHRLWLDNITTMDFGFTPIGSANVSEQNNSLYFTAGSYNFTASFDFPQDTQVTPSEIVTISNTSETASQQTYTQDLTFLSSAEKVYAGTWHFLTYFGRDTAYSLLLLSKVLSNSVLESGLSSMIIRMNNTGAICHEEVIGDYATYTHMMSNVTSTDPLCTYLMIDTDYLLQILLGQYLLDMPSANSSFLNATAMNAFDPSNEGKSFRELVEINAIRVLQSAMPFYRNQTKENLVTLRPDQPVGDWRDSNDGIGGGRIAYDVNTALIPAALRSIAGLVQGGYISVNASNITDIASVWEDKTLPFFEIVIPQATAVQRVQSYADKIGVQPHTNNITSDIFFHGISLDGGANLTIPIVTVMNSDDAIRHFLVNSTGNQTQLTGHINSTANMLNARFPVGLMTDVGAVVANPAYGDSDIYAVNFTNGAYHGTVVWSWNSMSMMAAGLERQLARCNLTTKPDFCNDTSVFSNAVRAYNHLWDVIEANTEHLAKEVWSWTYDNKTDMYNYIPLEDVPAPYGAAPDESDSVQLWSLSFLANDRNPAIK